MGGCSSLEILTVTRLLSLACALGLLAGVLAFARHGSNTVSFVQLGAMSRAAVPPSGAATLAG